MNANAIFNIEINPDTAKGMLFTLNNLESLCTKSELKQV